MSKKSVGARRVAAGAAGAACLVAVVLLATSAGGGGGSYTVRAIFDDAANAIPGENVKIGNGPPPEEKARIQGFFAPGGGLEFFTKGVTPTLLEFLSSSHTTTSSSGGFGPALFTKVPLIETLPGAADASTEKIVVYAGAAYKKGGKTTYYGTLPKKCPAGGFPIKAEITFATDGNEATPETASAVYKAPCPRK